MPKYDFRILIETKDGDKFSYGTSSFVDTSADTALTTTEAESRIRGMNQINYFNGSVNQATSSDNLFDSQGANTFQNTNIGSDYQYLSSSIIGNAESGSILFTANSTPHSNDFIKRYKFFGSKVCSVLGVPENYWVFADKFRLTNSGSEQNYMSGDVLAQSVNVRFNFAISNAGGMTTDLPFKHTKDTDRWIKWTDTSGSIPTNDLLIGYSNIEDNYMIRNQTNKPFVISGSISASGAVSIDTGGTSFTNSQPAFRIVHNGDETLKTNFAGDTRMDGAMTIGAMSASKAGVLHLMHKDTSTDSDTNVMADHQLVLSNKTNTLGAFSGIVFDVSTQSDIDAYGAAIRAVNSDSTDDLHSAHLTFRTANQTSANDDDQCFERMRITEDGNIGIGTTTPQELLHIQSDSDPTLVLSSTTENTTDSGKISFREGESNTERVNLRYAGIANKFIIDTQEVSNAFVVDRVSGKIGIGTDSPGEKLEVIGDISASGDILTSGDISASGFVFDETRAKTGEIDVSGTNIWRTIAVNPSVADSNSAQRASATFVVTDEDSGHHHSMTFIATHMFGMDAITVLNSGYFGSDGTFDAIRILSGDTYEGAVLQVHIASDAASPISNAQVHMYQNSHQRSGWEVVPFEDLTDAGDGTLSVVAAEVNLRVNESQETDQNQQGFISTAGIACAGTLSASKGIRLDDDSKIEWSKNLGKTQVFGSGNNLYLDTDNDIYFRNQDASKSMVFDGSSGRLQIGDENFSPPKALTVEGSISSSNTFFHQDGTNFNYSIGHDTDQQGFVKFRPDAYRNDGTKGFVFSNDGDTSILSISSSTNPRVGIGILQAKYPLDVRGNESSAYVGSFRNTTSTDSGDSRILQLWHSQEDSTADFDGSEFWINFNDNSGTTLGSINNEVSYNTFTGAHISQRPSGSSYTDWKPGLIVKSTGNLVNTGSKFNGISMAWPEVELTTTQKDKAVIGVFANTTEGTDGTSIGHNYNGLDNNLPALQYNALGEGKILVTDTNGNIETGDYICSSTRTGHGEKQDDDILHNYTVAKATQPIDFSTIEVDSNLGYKSVLVACTYHCG